MEIGMDTIRVLSCALLHPHKTGRNVSTICLRRKPACRKELQLHSRRERSRATCCISAPRPKFSSMNCRPLSKIGYLSLPFFNDLHHVRPTPAGDLLVANAGLEMVIHMTQSGEICNVWNV